MMTDPVTGKQNDLEVQGDFVRMDLDLLTEEEFAAALKVQVSTIAAWRSAEVGPAHVKLGKSVFYRREDVRTWIAKNVVSPPPISGVTQ